MFITSSVLQILLVATAIAVPTSTVGIAPHRAPSSPGALVARQCIGKCDSAANLENQESAGAIATITSVCFSFLIVYPCLCAPAEPFYASQGSFDFITASFVVPATNYPPGEAAGDLFQGDVALILEGFSCGGVVGVGMDFTLQSGGTVFNSGTCQPLLSFDAKLTLRIRRQSTTSRI